MLVVTVPRTITIALLAAATAGCTHKETAPAPVAATPVMPSPAAPAKPSAAPEPRPAHTLCDPTGTWRLSYDTGRRQRDDSGPFCGDIPAETFELALGFVGQDGQTVLAGAARPVGPAGPLGSLFPGMRVALVPNRASGCEVWLRVANGAGGLAPHADIVLDVSIAYPIKPGKVYGTATRWNLAAARDCSFTLSGERIATSPAAWAGLGEPVPPQPPAMPRPADAALTAAVAKISAGSLLGADLRAGVSIIDYVITAVGTHDDVTLAEVACTTPGRRCVAVVGDPCIAHPELDGCEGMFLTVVVDPERASLDRAVSLGYPVESHAEIEAWKAIAP